MRVFSSFFFLLSLSYDSHITLPPLTPSHPQTHPVPHPAPVLVEEVPAKKPFHLDLLALALALALALLSPCGQDDAVPTCSAFSFSLILLQDQKETT